MKSEPTLLRNHPLMRYKGFPDWPPTWTWLGGAENKCPRGEVGILKAVTLSKILPANRCYLYIDYEGASYIGCLLFDDRTFFRQVAEILQFCWKPIRVDFCDTGGGISRLCSDFRPQDHSNCQIADIGTLDVTFKL